MYIAIVALMRTRGRHCETESISKDVPPSWWCSLNRHISDHTYVGFFHGI